MFFSALKSHGRSATFRQHYYPEGGWGWVICFCCFLVNIFTTGLQLSFSILYLKILQHCESEVGPEDKISIGKYLLNTSQRVSMEGVFIRFVLILLLP